MIGWLEDGLETMVQLGYPYPSEWVSNSPVPAWPWRVTCHKMLEAGTPLGALRAVASVFHNTSGQAGHCFRPYCPGGMTGPSCQHGQPTGGIPPPSGDMPGDAWSYQTCTEVYQDTPTNGLWPASGGDMLLPQTPNKTAIFASCMERWGVVPRPEWEERQFWGPNIGTGSNIFLSYGQVDPWRVAGITGLPGPNPPASIEFYEILQGSHHLDLRASNPADPPSAVECRSRQQAAIQRWVSEWRANPPIPTQ